MANKLSLKIITPSRNMFEGEVDMVIMRTLSGDVGILYGHQPMVTILDYGVLNIKNDGEEKLAAVLGGFAEINDEGMFILTDAAEWSNEIDVLRAKQAKERAEARLRNIQDNIDIKRAELALKRALVRLDIGNLSSDKR
ncbi:MAG: F0F1 ATP synthase subunit epsilon [Clostridia bacterium]|nr:F0F1 ATP synthase subunit epsilon [Clostridia bacterium]